MKRPLLIACIAMGCAVAAAIGLAVLHYLPIEYTSLFQDDNSSPSPRAIPPDYSRVESVSEIIDLEYARLRALNGNYEDADLHIRTIRALQKAGPNMTRADFVRAVGDEFFAIRYEAADAFRKRHLKQWEFLKIDRDLEGAYLDTPDTASLPAALGKEHEFGDVLKTIADYDPKRDWRENCRIMRESAETKPYHYTRFMRETEPFLARFHSVANRKRIVAFGPPGFEPEDAVVFPFPTWFANILITYIHVHLGKGELKQAAELTRKFFDIMTRAELAANVLGALQALVLNSRLIKECILPCAEFGALSEDELDEMFKKGREFNLPFVQSMAHEMMRMLFWFTSSSWFVGQDKRFAAIGFAFAYHGPMTIDKWFDLDEAEFPAAVKSFERVLPDMLAGNFEVCDIDSAMEFQQLVFPQKRMLLGNIIRSVEQLGHVRDILGARSEWLQLRVRAEELRRGKPYTSFPEVTRALLSDPWIQIEEAPDGWKVLITSETLVSLGVPSSGDQYSFRLEPMKVSTPGND